MTDSEFDVLVEIMREIADNTKATRDAIEQVAAAFSAVQQEAPEQPIDPVAAGFQSFRARARQGG